MAEDLTREQAWTLFAEHTTSPVLIRHALAVEAAMRAVAVRMGGDQEYWGLVGLIHDFDYEKHPTADEHPLRRREDSSRARVSRVVGGGHSLPRDLQ